MKKQLGANRHTVGAYSCVYHNLWKAFPANCVWCSVCVTLGSVTYYCHAGKLHPLLPPVQVIIT